MEGTLLDGVTVSARALGWDARDNDGTEWALFHSDLPALTRVVGMLTVNWVDDPGYTQFVVNGIPVDPSSIVQEDHGALSVLTAAGTTEGAKKAWETIKAKKGFVPEPPPAGPKLQTPALDAAEAAALAETHAVHDWYYGPAGQAKIEAQAAQAAAEAHTAQVAAEAAAAEAAIAQAAVDQYEYQLKVAAATNEPEPVAADKSLVEVAKNGKEQLTKEAFADYLATASADSIPPGPLGAGQKAAVSKKLKAQALAADIAELDAIDAAAAKKAVADDTYAQAKAAGFDTPAIVPAPNVDVSAGVAETVEHEAKPAPVVPPKPPAPAAMKTASLADITAHTKKPGYAPPPPTMAQVNGASQAELKDYIEATTGKTAGFTGNTLMAEAKMVASQHHVDMASLATLGYPSSGLTAREARRAWLRETGERKATGGPGPGQAVHNTIGASTIEGMDRAKLEAIVIHHSSGHTSAAALKNITTAELKQMAVKADKEYGDTVSKLAEHGIPSVQIPHSAYGAKQLYLGKSKGLPLPAGTTAAKPPTKAAVAQQAAAAAKAAKKAAADAKKTPAQLAAKPANWGSMTAGQKWSWSHTYNLAAKGVYPKSATSKGSTHALGKHTVVPFATIQQAAKAHEALVDSMATSLYGHTAYDKAETAFSHAATPTQRAAWEDYYGSGYTSMNGCLKRGVGCNSWVNAQNDALKAAIKQHGVKAPKILFRGKTQGAAKDFARQVGSEFVDPGFGSWSDTKSTPKGFGGVGNHGVSVFYRMVDSKNVRAAPSGSGEREWILPPGAKFRVLAITDSTAGSQTQRVLDIELIHAPYG